MKEKKKLKKKGSKSLKVTLLNPFKYHKVEISLAKIKIGDKRFVYKFDDGYDDYYFKAKSVSEAKKKYRNYQDKYV